MPQAERFFGKMQEDQNNQEATNLEDNLPMVTYIMLHRIYDMLTIIANKTVGSEDVQKMIDYHDAGYLLGPAPSFRPSEE